MASSLDKLSRNLKIDQFVNLKKYFSDNQLSLLLRKGVYPYDYVDCLKKLDETSLPTKEAFYFKLLGEGITDEDYQHAHTVWRESNIESMMNYHKSYNLSAVLQDETGGKQIVKFVGLRAKLYFYKMLGGFEEKKCKEVTQKSTKRSIQFDDYRECLFSRKAQHRKLNIIRSHSHEIYTEEINKIALSSDDDKRVIMTDGIHTLAYGHKNLKTL